MNPPIKKTISIVAAVFILTVAYYGSYLPFRKSRVFIDALQNLNSVKSIDEMERVFSSALDPASPIGQEELIRNITNTVVNLVNQSGANPELTKRAVAYVTSYFKPIMDRGKGMSFGQNLYVLGALNELAFLRTNDPVYLNAAGEYFARGNAMSPKRPQFLYGLLDVYGAVNRLEDAKKIAEQILAQWPDDERAKKALVEILERLTKKK